MNRMMDLSEVKPKKNITSSAMIAGLDAQERERLEEQYVRARPFLKHLNKVFEREIARTLREEEHLSSDVNIIMKMIGRRSGIRFISDLINK